MVVDVNYVGRVAVVTITNPPVNAVNAGVRQALWDLIPGLDADAVVLTGAGKMFVGGADLTEFDRPVEDPTLPQVIALIEASQVPWTAAIHGVALGGGLELALACHLRVAAPGTRFALPEVSLGIIPGAGGTQRLPRLIGVEAAIPVVAEMASLNTETALAHGLVDHIATGDLVTEAVAFALTPVPVRSFEPPAPEVWTEAEARLRRSAKGMTAPLLALAALRHGVENGLTEGLRNEREVFLKLRASDEAAALRHLFFAERAAPRPPALRDTLPRPVTHVGVIGGGTMGVGIAAALRNAGLPVVLVEQNDAALSRAITALSAIFDAAQRKGAMSASDAEARLKGVRGAVGYAALAECDLVIEAVFEDLPIKRAVFAELAAVCAPHTILATNTSYIDPIRIVDGLPHPDRFLGLHFFSPAHLMKLLEVIPLPDTAPDVLAAAFTLAGKLRKIPVQSGICDGFIGNRILRRTRAAAEALLHQGVPFADIDAAMRGYGYAMGPFEMQDLAGLDISYMHLQAARAAGQDIAQTPGDILVEAGRKGQKTQSGWYDYNPGDRTPKPSATTAALLAPLLPAPITMAPEAITNALLTAMAEEGGAILAEGIARTPADIDLVLVHGYGFPRQRGGPMFQATRGDKTGQMT